MRLALSCILLGYTGKCCYNCCSMIQMTTISQSGLMLPADPVQGVAIFTKVIEQPDTGEEVQESFAAMILGKRTPPGVYHEFFEEMLALARKHKCSALSVRVTRRNDPTTQMDWRAPVEEALDVFEVRNAESNSA